MKTLVTIIVPLIIGSCALDNSSNITKKNPGKNGFSLFNPTCQVNNYNTQNMEPYTLIMNLEKEKKNNYILSLNMRLSEGAYYVSPNSKGNYTGQLKIKLDNNTYITMDNDITETPNSIESIDPWTNKPVNFVTKNTVHKQLLKIKPSIEDFEVSGMVSFTIEPHCTFEENPFTIYSKSGKISLIHQMRGCYNKHSTESN